MITVENTEYDLDALFNVQFHYDILKKLMEALAKNQKFMQYKISDMEEKMINKDKKIDELDKQLGILTNSNDKRFKNIEITLNNINKSFTGGNKRTSEEGKNIVDIIPIVNSISNTNTNMNVTPKEGETYHKDIETNTEKTKDGIVDTATKITDNKNQNNSNDNETNTNKEVKNDDLNSNITNINPTNVNNKENNTITNTVIVEKVIEKQTNTGNHTDINNDRNNINININEKISNNNSNSNKKIIQNSCSKIEDKSGYSHKNEAGIELNEIVTSLMKRVSKLETKNEECTKMNLVIPNLQTKSRDLESHLNDHRSWIFECKI
jgi:hypothetical protein